MEPQSVQHAPEELGEIADLIIGVHHDLLEAIARLQRVQPHHDGRSHLVELALDANESVVVLEAELLVHARLTS